MPPNASRQDDRAWEKEFAPKVTRKRVIMVAVIYTVWLLFLAGLSAERWFFSFQ
ncbi:MAG: hypothetical protein IPK83_23410 [Planctomycetes bacterium]|nr:hypothetical protein [Planctomycetota bacterium]